MLTHHRPTLANESLTLRQRASIALVCSSDGRDAIIRLAKKASLVAFCLLTLGELGVPTEEVPLDEVQDSADNEDSYYHDHAHHELMLRACAIATALAIMAAA